MLSIVDESECPIVGDPEEDVIADTEPVADEPVSTAALLAAEACKVRLAANAELERAIRAEEQAWRQSAMALKLVCDLYPNDSIGEQTVAQRTAFAEMERLTAIWRDAAGNAEAARAAVCVANRTAIADALTHAVRDKMPSDRAAPTAAKIAVLLMK